MKKTFVRDLRSNDQVDSQFAVKYKKPPRRYQNGFMFEVRLCDRTDEITGKYWGGQDEGGVQRIYESFDANDVVHVTGRVSEFRNALEIAIDDSGVLKKCSHLEYDIGDFVAKADRDTGGMMAELGGIIDTIENGHLKKLLDSFFGDERFAGEFRKTPGSMTRHHNYIGGLLEHTLNVVLICNEVQKLHPKLDRDLLLTGAILHDIGKIREYRVTTNIDVSREGMLIGHVVMGEEMVMERVRSIEDFPEILGMKIAHMLLSHHGKHEYGSPKQPQFPEAMALYFADEIDAKVSFSICLKEEAKTEDPWVWTKDFGHVFLE